MKQKQTPTPPHKPEDCDLDFVVRYYQAGKFNTQEAIRRIVPARVVPLWRKVAVAASFALLLVGGAFATYMAFSGNEAPQESPVLPQSPQATAMPLRHFHFDNTPLPDVLRELGDYYGVTLSADAVATGTDGEQQGPPPTDRRLTADFDSEDVDETIRMIEQVLDVRIRKE